MRPGENDPLLQPHPNLKSTDLSTLNLQDGTQDVVVESIAVMRAVKKSPRGLGRKAPPRRRNGSSSFGDYSSGGHFSRLIVTLDTRFWPRGFESRSIRLKLFLFACYSVCLLWTLTVLVCPLVLHFVEKEKWCNQDVLSERYLKRSGDDSDTSRGSTGSSQVVEEELSTNGKIYENPDYNTDPCRYMRLSYLAGMTLEECDYCRRMLVAVLLGGAIGYERRSSDRPAGIRTMGLVSLGACFFTLSSISAFKSSTMGWDASRVTASLPSGVGFLGAALIWKGKVAVDSQEMHQVHGLTTAASVWLSAAIGVGAGGALYFASIYSTALILLVLRYGPRLYLHGDEDCDKDETALETELRETSDATVEVTVQPIELQDKERDCHLTRSKKRIATFHG